MADHGVGVAAAVALAGIVALLVLQLLQGPPDGTTLVLAAAAATLLFGLLAPAESNRFFQRLTNLRFVHAITHMHDRVSREDEYRQIAFTLAAEGLLRGDEPQFVLDLISGRDLGVEALPAKPKQEFLDAAWSFAARFGFVLWDRFVRDALTGRGWVVADFPQAKGHRPDFLAYWKGAGKWALMSARVGEVENPFPYPWVRDRLESAKVNVPIRR